MSEGGSEWIERVGPINLTPKEANALLGEVSGIVEQYEVNDHPKADVLHRVERKLHAAVVVNDCSQETGSEQ